jgi:hypothetical protein
MTVALKKVRTDETAMQIAMKDAGIVSPAEEGEKGARALAREAWERHPTDAKERRKYLTARFMPQPIYWVMHKTNPALLAHGIGWLINLIAEERQPKIASSVTSLSVAAAPGPIITQNSDRGHRPGAEPLKYKFGFKPDFSGPISDQNRGAAARARSKLDTVLIGGMPVRFSVVSAAREWAAMVDKDAQTLKTEATFIRNLCMNLPGDTVIGDYWKDMDEVERLYERSSATLTITHDAE